MQCGDGGMNELANMCGSYPIGVLGEYRSATSIEQQDRVSGECEGDGHAGIACGAGRPGSANPHGGSTHTDSLTLTVKWLADLRTGGGEEAAE